MPDSLLELFVFLFNHHTYTMQKTTTYNEFVSVDAYELKRNSQYNLTTIKTLLDQREMLFLNVLNDPSACICTINVYTLIYL